MQSSPLEHMEKQPGLPQMGFGKRSPRFRMGDCVSSTGPWQARGAGAGVGEGSQPGRRNARGTTGTHVPSPMPAARGQGAEQGSSSSLSHGKSLAPHPRSASPGTCGSIWHGAGEPLHQDTARHAAFAAHAPVSPGSCQPSLVIPFHPPG